MTDSFRMLWIADMERNRDYWSTDPKVCRNWEKASPEMEADSHLLNAFEILYSAVNDELAAKFLSATVAVADRCIAEDKLRSPQCIAGFPYNRARILRARAYAHALLNHELGREGLLQSSADFEQWCHELKRRKWDSQDEAAWMNAIRTALVAGDLERGRTLLAHKRAGKWHEMEAEALRLASSPESLTVVQKDRFDEVFDHFRNPDLKPDVFVEKELVRLELGILRQRLVYGDQDSSFVDIAHLVGQ